MVYLRNALVRYLRRAGLTFLLFMASALVVYAADGSGTNTVNPTTVSAGTTTSTLTFTFTAAESMNSGEMTITAPSGWSAPQGTPGVPGYTTVATAGMIGTVLDSADATTGWTAGTACTTGFTTDGTTKFEGSSSIRCTNGDEATSDEFYKTISVSDWSSFTTISFWIRSSASVATNRIFFGHAEATVFTGQNDVTIGALTANTWTHITHTFPGAVGTRNAVESFGFIFRNSATDLDGVTIYVDDFLIGPGVATFPGGGDVRTRLMSLSNGQTVTVTYGSGGGSSGATAPASPETSAFTTKTRVNSSGTLTSIASSPTVTVTGGGGGPDTTAPSAIANLALSGATASSIDLTWTAPGDDNNSGTATSYDVRYSTSNINDGNFGSATAVTGEPSPAVAGASQNMTVSGLTANTTYFFAMKTSDEVPNTSAISNVPSLATSASGGSSPSDTGGSTGGAGAPTPLETSVLFSGFAYPGGSLEVFKKASTNDRYILNPLETVSVSADGLFEVRETGVIGGKYVYALRFLDIDKRSTNVFYDVDLLSQSHVSTEAILVPPTVEIKNRLLSRTEDLQIVGYAAANSSIEVDIDGMLRGGNIHSNSNGFYAATIGPGSLAVGTHYLKVRQVDADGKKSDFSTVQAFKKSLLVAQLADFDDDGKINITDWSVFLFRWNSNDDSLRATIDLDSSGMIDIFDLSIFLKAIEL